MVCKKKTKIQRKLWLKIDRLEFLLECKFILKVAVEHGYKSYCQVLMTNDFNEQQIIITGADGKTPLQLHGI